MLSMPVSTDEPKRIDVALGLAFGAGLGDAVHFAHLLQLYVRRGYRVSVRCQPDKRLVYAAAGLPESDRETVEHPWLYLAGFNRPVLDGDLYGNRIAGCLNAPPLPMLGSIHDLWAELCGLRLDGAASRLVPAEIRADVRAQLDSAASPIILLHTEGHSYAPQKNLPPDLVRRIQFALLARMRGTVIVLDWSGRLEALDHPRVLHLRRHLAGVQSLAELTALYDESALLIGVDSGPYHFASLTHVPALGIFTGHHPSCVGLPRKRNVNMVAGGTRWRAVNDAWRQRWNLVEHKGPEVVIDKADPCRRPFRPAPTTTLPCAEQIAEVAVNMLARHPLE